MAAILSRGKRHGLVAVADVGTASAGFALVEARPHAPAKVVAAERMLLPIEERTKEASIAAVASELERVAKKVLTDFSTKHKNHPPHPGSLLCVIRAPWTKSETTKESKHFEKDTSVTAAVIGELAKQCLAKVTEVNKTNFLEGSVMRVELNGYPTRQPEGKKARDVRVISLVSDCEPALRAAVEKSLEAVLPHTPRTLKSGTRALLSLLREYSPGEDYMAVEVGGEGTALISFRDGAPSDQSLVPEGISTILRRVSAAGMPEDTLSLMRMIARNECTTPACEAVVQSLARVEPELVRVFGEGMAKCATSHKLPNRLILATHPDVAPWLEKFFSRIDFTQFTRTAQPFSVEVLSPERMGAWVSADTGVALDTGLATVAALVNIETGSET